ncbi:hypothetical protein RR46_08570, partial [Papilio xuthus]
EVWPRERSSRRDEHNPPPCVGGHSEPGTDASVAKWPSAAASPARRRTHALPRPLTMRCGSTASGDRKHRRPEPTLPSEYPDRDCSVIQA